MAGVQAKFFEAWPAYRRTFLRHGRVPKSFSYPPRGAHVTWDPYPTRHLPHKSWIYFAWPTTHARCGVSCKIVVCCCLQHFAFDQVCIALTYVWLIFVGGTIDVVHQRLIRWRESYRSQESCVVNLFCSDAGRTSNACGPLPDPQIGVGYPEVIKSTSLLDPSPHTAN